MFVGPCLGHRFHLAWNIKPLWCTGERATPQLGQGYRAMKRCHLGRSGVPAAAGVSWTTPSTSISMGCHLPWNPVIGLWGATGRCQITPVLPCATVDSVGRNYLTSRPKCSPKIRLYSCHSTIPGNGIGKGQDQIGCSPVFSSDR